jgi:tRNA modification GTPase
MLQDTIAAIATPIGEGGLAVIRVSGPEALAVGDRCFRPAGRQAVKPSAAGTHTLHYGHVTRGETVVDEVMLSVLRAPRTFTREDTVEFSCHGGLVASKAVLDTVLAAGARLAHPGEFTQRAFLNGRIDLAQAEAVADLIHARTELALSAANEQLAGKLSRRINELRDGLMLALAHIEAHIDFPEEDIAPDTQAQLLQRLTDGVVFMDELLRTANEGQILRRGIRAAIIGRPNAGKSSLLNQLLGHERAIVSPVAGTTRDTIEETANVRGLPVVFVDTAGLREAQDLVEQEGVRRSRASGERAELILHVLDASEPLTAEDEQFLAEFAGKKRVVVVNKVDLARRLGLEELRASLTPSLTLTLSPSEGEREQQGTGAATVEVCCISGAGIETLKDAIKAAVWSGGITAENLQVMINARHQDALRRGREATLNSITALRDDHGLEIVALELRIATNAIGEVVGKTTTEDLLDAIFSQFCLGK